MCVYGGGGSVFLIYIALIKRCNASEYKMLIYLGYFSSHRKINVV